MKTNRIIVLMTMLMLATLCACGSQVSSQNDNVEATPEPNPLMKSIRESEIDYLDDVQLFEMVFEEYSIREVIEMRYYSIGEFLYEEGIPDMFLILEELRSQGYSDDIEKLLEIADNIGYGPSAIIGNYYADENHIIHKTVGSCFDNTLPAQIIPIGPFASDYEVEHEIEDEDSYLVGFFLCQKCIG